MPPNQKSKKYIPRAVTEGRIITDKKRVELFKEKLDAKERKKN